MKKLFLASALALFGAMNAQTEKGSWVVGGSTTLGFNSLKTEYKYDGDTEDGPTVSTFALTPSVGYFVMDNLAIGLDLGFTSIKTKEESEGWNNETTASTLALLPTATYYFKGSSNILPYLGAGVGYGSTNIKYKETYLGESDSDEDSYGGLAYKAKGGIVFLLNSNVGLDLGLSYVATNGKLDSDNDVKVNSGGFGANVGFSVFFK